MMSRAKRNSVVCLAILLFTALAAKAQDTSQSMKQMRYPSGQGYFLFTNMEKIVFCNELPRSIPGGSVDIQKLPCLVVRTKTALRGDQGIKPSVWDLKNLYGLAFWISLFPATIALCCFTDKAGVARLGRMAANFIALLSAAKGLQKSILTAAVLAVTASPLLFAVAWGTTRHSTLTVMIDNAQDSGAQVEIGEVKAFYVPPMSRVFVYINHPQPRTPIHVTSTRGYEDRAVLVGLWNDEGMPWIYDVGGANQDHIGYATYLRR